MRKKSTLLGAFCIDGSDIGVEPARASRFVRTNIPTSLCLHIRSCANTGAHTPLEDRQARLSGTERGYIRGAKPRVALRKNVLKKCKLRKNVIQWSFRAAKTDKKSK